MKSIFNIHEQWQELYGIKNPLELKEYLQPTPDQNALIVKELEGEAEIMVCLSEKVMKSLSDTNMPQDFSWNLLPDLSVAIEELSHFNMFCMKAFSDQATSQLELEVQGEVDKFALALNWLEQRNEDHLRAQLFDILFADLNLKPEISDTQKERYEAAHQIARQFCRRVMETPEQKQTLLKQFLHSPLSEKLSPKY